MVTKKATKGDDVQVMASVPEVHQKTLRFNLIGVSPLIEHAMSSKGIHSLLFPAPKKNAAEKATSMKHEPWEEFREAAYKFRDQDNKPTRLYMPAGSFHTAMASVAVDMAGARKSQIGRLTSVPGLKIPIYGVPQIVCLIVRSSDMARTPDIRTLPVLPEWAATIEVSFVDLVPAQSVVNLLSAAGVIMGIGDGRPEKGKLTFGQFRLCSDDDPNFRRIVATGGTKAQDAALKNPAYFDEDTERMLTWFEEERVRRTASAVHIPRRASKPDDTAPLAAAKNKQDGKRPSAN